MPLHMRTPKLRGFKNPFRVEYQVVNLEKLGELYPAGRRRHHRATWSPRAPSARTRRSRSSDRATSASRSPSRSTRSPALPKRRSSPRADPSPSNAPEGVARHGPPPSVVYPSHREAHTCSELSRGSCARPTFAARSGSRSASSRSSGWGPSSPLRSSTTRTCSSASPATRARRASTSSSTSSAAARCCSSRSSRWASCPTSRRRSSCSCCAWSSRTSTPSTRRASRARPS